MMDETTDELEQDPEAGAEPAPDDPAALRELAEAYLERDQVAEAVAVYTRLVELAPDDPDPLEGRAWAQVAAGAPDAVRADIARLLDRFPESAPVAAAVGELYLALEDRDEALHALDRATALAGADEETLYRVARDFEEADAPEPALALYDRLVAWRPREVLLARAALRMDQEEPAAALADLDRALAAPPGGSDPAWDAASTARVLVARARAHFELDNLDAAEADAQAALAQVPAAPPAAEAATLLAEMALVREDVPAARRLADAAIAQDPDYLPGWLALLTAHTAVRDFQGALAVLARAQVQHPSDTNLILSAALIRGEMEDFQGALGEWDRLLAVLPDNPTAFAMRGAVYLQLDRPRDARADVERALALDPRNLTALQTRVSLYLRAGNLRGALADLDRALAVEPHDTDLLLLRAQLHLEQEDPLAAAADYTRLLEIAPESAAGFSGLGNVQMVMGQYEAALRSYEAALRAAPDAGAGYYNLAVAQAMLGRCPQAIELLRRAIAADPSFAEAAREDGFLDGCRDHPGFAAALRGGPAPGPRPPAKPPKRRR